MAVMSEQGNKRVPAILTSHLKTKAEKDSWKESYFNSTFVTDPIKKVISKKIDKVNKTSEDDYNVASWAYLQADKIGYERALKEIIDLLP